MAHPVISIDDLPEQVTADGYTVVQVAGVTKKLAAVTLAGETTAIDHIADTTDAHPGSAISASPGTNLTANNVDGQLDQVDTALTALDGRLDALEAGGGDPLLGEHLTDVSDAHDASAISFVPTGGIAATDVQAAIVEAAADGAGALNGHLASSTSHTANTIVFTPASTVAATDVQGAITELANETQANITNLAGQIAALGPSLPNRGVRVTGYSTQAQASTDIPGASISITAPANTLFMLTFAVTATYNMASGFGSIFLVIDGINPTYRKSTSIAQGTGTYINSQTYAAFVATAGTHVFKLITTITPDGAVNPTLSVPEAILIVQQVGT